MKSITTSMENQDWIDLPEAQRRAEGMLVRQGYVAMGRWVETLYADSKEPIYSMKLVGLDDTRILLWKEPHFWRCTIAIAVGRTGDFPIAGGRIERSKTRFIPPFEKLKDKIEESRKTVGRWNYQPANTYSAQALARLTEYFLRKKHYRKARMALSLLMDGTINAATVSEALSMVQTLVAKHREDRIESALIWAEVYK